MSKGIQCPHCEHDISKAYAVKSLAMLAKSEGHDLGEELNALAGDEVSPEDSDGEDVAEKAMKKKTDVGNQMHPHKGKASGAVNHPHAGAKKVDGKSSPSIAKSLRLPVTIGQPQIVSYEVGSDNTVAKGISDGSHHVEIQRNNRRAREEFTGETAQG